MTLYNLDLEGMPKERVYELIDLGLNYEDLVRKVLDDLCGKCIHEPMGDGCLKQAVCIKRGSVKRIFERMEMR